MLPISHLCACIWIYIGRLDKYEPVEKRESWLAKPDNVTNGFENTFLKMEEWKIYVFAFYWIWEIFSTVGYGDYTGTTSTEF